MKTLLLVGAILLGVAAAPQLAHGEDARSVEVVATVPAPSGAMYLLDSLGCVWLEPAGSAQARVLVDKGVVAIANGPRQTIYALGSNGQLFNEDAGWQQHGRREVDRAVSAIAQGKNGKLYILGTDGKLWAGSCAEGRIQVDRDVRNVVPGKNGSIYVLGTDGKLWAGSCAEGRIQVDRDVRNVVPGKNGSIYVLGTDGKLWAGSCAEGRIQVDESVVTLAPGPRQTALVLGSDGKFFFEDAGWQQHGRGQVDQNIVATQLFRERKEPTRRSVMGLFDPIGLSPLAEATRPRSDIEKVINLTFCFFGSCNGSNNGSNNHVDITTGKPGTSNPGTSNPGTSKPGTSNPGKPGNNCAGTIADHR